MVFSPLKGKLLSQPRRYLLKTCSCVSLWALIPAWAQNATPVSWRPVREASLGYSMTGYWKTSLSGNGSLDWKFSPDISVYVMKLNISAVLLAMNYSSVGFLTQEQGMIPTLYTEQRTGRDKRAVTIDHVKNQISYSWKEGTTSKPPGVQDITSAIFQIGYLMAQKPQNIHVGQQFIFPVARMGHVRQWTFRVEESTEMQTPVGPYKVWHVKRLVDSNDQRADLQAEFWLAPLLRYFPVAINFTLKDGAYLNVLLNKIDQFN